MCKHLIGRIAFLVVFTVAFMTCASWYRDRELDHEIQRAKLLVELGDLEESMEIMTRLMTGPEGVATFGDNAGRPFPPHVLKRMAWGAGIGVLVLLLWEKIRKSRAGRKPGTSAS